MNKKYKKELLWGMIGGMILATIIIFTTDYLFKDEYNQDKDICTLDCVTFYEVGWGICNVGIDRCREISNIYSDKLSEYAEKCDYRFAGEEYNVKWRNTKCLEWHEKNYCELNPNDESKCVCEEYENRIDCNEHICMVTNWGEGEILDIEFVGAEEIKECIKAHERTPYDYSCEELKKYIFLGDHYCPKDNIWKHKNEGWVGTSCYSWDDLEFGDIAIIFLENGCEI